MKAEVISVGSELTSGQNLDTNSQWLSRELAAIGIAVHFHTTVADEHSDNVAAFRTAVQRVGLVIITGGLGPTLDDLTRAALAEVAGVELMFDQASFDIITAMFAKRNRPMPERNRLQALFPAGATPIPNVNGTAPGIWMQVGECIVAALPGVPREMKAMFGEWVRPRICELGLGEGVLIERKINAFGAGESHIEQMLADLTARDRTPRVGITASDAVISLRISAHAKSENEANELIAPAENLIRSRLGSLVYGDGADELHQVVAIMLVERAFTVATAESITAGQVGQLFAKVPGASNWLLGGVIAYTNLAKEKLLGVPSELIQRHGAVSAPVAEAMAVGVRQLLGSHIGVSTTGLAGPGDGGEGRPVGTVYVALAWDGGVVSRLVNWFGSREEIQSRSAKSAINLIRLWLLHEQ